MEVQEGRTHKISSARSANSCASALAATHAIGIVHETKNRWERRVPLIPEEVAALVSATPALLVTWRRDGAHWAVHTAALDPRSADQVISVTRQVIEASQLSALMVTHSMQQAARVSDFTAFFYMGELIEYGDTETMFTRPSQKKTEEYITGRFG